MKRPAKIKRHKPRPEVEPEPKRSMMKALSKRLHDEVERSKAYDTKWGNPVPMVLCPSCQKVGNVKRKRVHRGLNFNTPMQYHCSNCEYIWMEG